MLCYFFSQNRSDGTTTRVRARTLFSALSLLLVTNVAYAQQGADNSDTPWHVGVSGNGPVPVKMPKLSAAFPRYDIHAYCNGDIDYCEQKQQAMYERARLYWNLLTVEEKVNSNSCAGRPERSNYADLLTCIDLAHQMHNVDEMQHPEPFHY